ncbi:MAG: glycoside hydrolase family 36 protein [Kiritimatiellia bacterium]
MLGLLATLSAVAAPFETICGGSCVGPVKVTSPEAGGWSFAVTRGTAADGVETMEIALTAAKPLPPPRFSVSFDFDQVDAHHKWTTRTESVTLPPNWNCRTGSRLCDGMPLVAFLNDNDRNRATICCSEAKRVLGIEAGLREEDCRLVWKIDFFDEAEAPLAAYRAQIRFDRRDVFFGDAIAAGARWIAETAGLKPAPAPEAAFEPLYSSWYSFHQNVHDADIEAECAEAAKLGMKVLIVDDGWQTDDNNRGYAYCGDWQVSKRRFPDMAAHVARVHALGMKYMIWYGVPMIGIKSANYARFKGKYLWTQNDRWSGYSCLDPRFPEVRRFLCGIYERAMREWDLDGLKLDFIDAIGFRGEDPAVRENYADRDIRSLSEAVDQLMKEVHATLTAVKPEALVEFRQSYIGPGIRQYGNMMRAGDCPGDLLANRCRIANLRLTSGETAVHADMLEWNAKEAPEQAARFVLSTMFGVIQYSVMLRTLPEAHKRMVAHWLEFSKRHRSALLKGAFRPRHYEAFYPVIEAEDARERIVGVYNDAVVADCGAADRDVYILNATGKSVMAVRLAAKPAKVEAFDTFGQAVAAPVLAAGIQEVPVPASGYLKISFAR